MIKISRKLSTTISLVLTIVFMCVIICAVIIMPALVRVLLTTPDNIGNHNDITVTQRTVVIIIAYALVLFAAIADVFLFFLLVRVRAGLVFTNRSVALTRGVSWCCIAIGLLFGLLGIWFTVSFGVGFAAIFVGICLRVVKNLIEEAIQIKAENDLMV